MKLRVLLGLLAAFAAPAAGAVTLESAIGNVSVQLGPGAPFLAATAGMELPQGATVRTGPNGRALLRFAPTDVVRLADRSELKVSLLPAGRNRATILSLAYGRVRAMLRRAVRPRTPDFAIAAGSTLAAVKGTDFELDLGAEGGTATLRVDTGSVTVAPLTGTQMTNLVAAFNEAAIGRGTPVVGGTQVDLEGGTVSAPIKAVPRTTLEVVSSTGTVTYTVNGVTKTAQPGDEIPSGAQVQVTGGTAVLVGGTAAYSAGSGADFTFTANTAGNASVASAGSPLTVDQGNHNTTTVQTGGTLTLAAGGGTSAGDLTGPVSDTGTTTTNPFSDVMNSVTATNPYTPPPSTSNTDQQVVSGSSPQ